MSISLQDRIRKRREEEDDDMMMFMFPALYLMGSSRGGGEKKQRRHTSSETGEVKVRRLLEGHVKNCQVAFWMEPHIFREVATYLRRRRLVVDTRITVEEKLGFFLYMLSRNASYEDLQLFFEHSNDTFHHHINHFFKVVIPTLAPRFLRPPDPNQVHPKIEDNPEFYPFFKNCLGAIDGTHIPVSISPEKHSPFRNRKGSLSINVMVACDFDLNVMPQGWDGNLVHEVEDEFCERSGGQRRTNVAAEDAEDEPQGRDVIPSRDEESDALPVERSGQRRSAAAPARKKHEKGDKRPRKSEKIEGVMERYIEMRQKQSEDETALWAREMEAREREEREREAREREAREREEREARERENAQVSDFSIRRCFSVLNTMEMTKEEKAKAYSFFTKNKDNREAFICACELDEEAALIWLRSEMA